MSKKSVILIIFLIKGLQHGQKLLKELPNKLKFCPLSHNEELNNLYSFPNIIRQIKSRKNDVGEACGTHGRGEKGI
jgi:hypothetical protein